MKIEQRGSELHVEFPIQLKDSFKATFRTAKWNSGSRTWYVSSRSRAKLEAWIKAAEESGALMTAEEFDAMEVTERDLERMTTDLAALKRSLDVERKRFAGIEEKRKANAEMLQHLSSLRADLDLAAAQTKAAAEAEKAETASIETVVASIINLSSIRSAHSQMIREAKQGATSKGKDRFDAHAEVIWTALCKLRENGIDSEQMRILANANYNRKHKDLGDWDSAITFQPYVKSEEDEE